MFEKGTEMITREEKIEKYRKEILQLFPSEEDPQAQDFLADRAAFWYGSALFWRNEYCKLREVQK